MGNFPEPIREPRRLYIVHLEAYAEAVVIARGREHAKKVLDICNWTDGTSDFEIESIIEITDEKRLAFLDPVEPDAEKGDVPDGNWKKILKELFEEQNQAKIEAEFRAKQLTLLDAAAPLV